MGPSFTYVRQGRYKYIRWLRENEIEELYDLDKDPEELINLAVVSEYDDLLQEFRKKMKAELKRTAAPFVDSMPAVKIRHDGI